MFVFRPMLALPLCVFRFLLARTFSRFFRPFKHHEKGPFSMFFLGNGSELCRRQGRI